MLLFDMNPWYNKETPVRYFFGTGVSAAAAKAVLRQHKWDVPKSVEALLTSQSSDGSEGTPYFEEFCSIVSPMDAASPILLSHSFSVACSVCTRFEAICRTYLRKVILYAVTVPGPDEDEDHATLR